MDSFSAEHHDAMMDRMLELWTNTYGTYASYDKEDLITSFVILRSTPQE